MEKSLIGRIDILKYIISNIERLRTQCLEAASVYLDYEIEKENYFLKAHQYGRQIEKLRKRLSELTKEIKNENTNEVFLQKKMPMPFLYKTRNNKLSYSDYRTIEKET